MFRRGDIHIAMLDKELVNLLTKARVARPTMAVYDNPPIARRLESTFLHDQPFNNGPVIGPNQRQIQRIANPPSYILMY